MQPLSAVIITYNEEHNLSRSLAKLTWCDEIIVVDSGSTDRTLAICESYDCKVYYRAFDGYGMQKRYAVSLAKNKWVLCLDADEVLSDGLVDELQQVMKNPTVDGYLIPLTFVFMGKKFRHGKEAWRYFLRLFNKEVGNFDERKVHEKIVLGGKKEKLEHNILHYSYRSISQYFNKFNKYSSYGAEISYHQGKNRSLFMIITAVPLNFLKYYFLELNFMNGISGFYWSTFNAFYHFVKYIKLREIYEKMEELKKLGISHLPYIDLEPDYQQSKPTQKPVEKSLAEEPVKTSN